MTGEGSGETYEPDLEDIVLLERAIRHKPSKDPGGYTKGETRTEDEIDEYIAYRIRKNTEDTIKLRLVQQVRAERMRDKNWWRELIDMKWRH